MSLSRNNSGDTIKIYLLGQKDHIITPHYGFGLMGGTFFLDLDELVNFYVNVSEFYAVQYALPSDLKEKLYTAYNTFKEAPSSRAFSDELLPCNLINADTFTGYWEISRNKKENEIIKIFISRDTLINKIVTSNIKETDNKILTRQNRISYSSLFFIGTTLFCGIQQSAISYLICAGSLGLLFMELYQQRNELDKGIQSVELLEKMLSTPQSSVNVPNKGIQISLLVALTSQSMFAKKSENPASCEKNDSSKSPLLNRF